MPIGTLEKATVAGIRADLAVQLEAFPEFWRPHCTEVDAKTKIQQFVWGGSIPQPREMGAGRRIQEIRAFSYNIEDNTYELSVLFPREWFEDDQLGLIRSLISDITEAWKIYKSYLFNYMLEQGGTLLAYDGSTFFHDTRTEGDSGTIDNNLTSVAAAASAVPTTAEFIAAMNTIKTALQLFKDDRGNLANVGAMQQLQVIAEVDMEEPILTALAATEISSTSNVFAKGMAGLDLNPYHTVDATPTKTMYVHAIGSHRKAMVHQERLALEMLLYDDPYWVDKNNGLLVTLRERFVFAYGEFRRMIKYVFTT